MIRHVAAPRARGVDGHGATRRKPAPRRAARVAGARSSEDRSGSSAVAFSPAETSSPRRRTGRHGRIWTSPVTRPRSCADIAARTDDRVHRRDICRHGPQTHGAIWNCADGRRTVELIGHQQAVACAEFPRRATPSSRAAADGSARTWDLAGRQTATSRGTRTGCRSPGFALGDRVLTGAGDRSARSVDLTGKQLAVFEAEAASSPPSSRMPATKC